MTQQFPIEEIIERCRHDDRKAQRLLFNQYRELAYRLVYRFLGPRPDVDDVLQQIFIEIFQSLDSFQGRAAFDTWVYRIASNICMEKLRQQYKKRQLDMVSNQDLEEIPDESENALTVRLEQDELRKKIYEALDKVEGEKRIIIVLHDMENKTLEEIAALVGRPVGTVKSRLFYGREEMKRHLAAYLKQ